ncbi:MAG: hypothetical protein K2H47_02790 [Muribaculaceae bacterium]|nr:hypothetical protein [Muribaculaceae bacterium]
MTDDLLNSTDSLTSLGAPRPAGVLDVMLHPWRTLMLLEHMAKDLAYIPALRDGLREAALLLDAQRCENVALSARNTDMAVRLREAIEALTRSNAALEKAKEQLEDYEAVDEAMRQFTEQLSQAEIMKHKYEQRISTLKTQLRDAREALTALTGVAYADPDDLQIIDMRDYIHNTVNIPPRRPASSEESADVVPEDVPQEEQETDMPPEPPGPIMPPPKRRRKPSPYLPPASERLRTDDSDWWVDLPEEL